MTDMSKIAEIAARSVERGLAAYERALKDPNTGSDPMYARLGGEDDEGEARDTLKSMREPSDEVLLAGIAPMQWRKAIDLMLAKADVLDAIAWAEVAAQHVAEWPGRKARLEALGLKLSEVKGSNGLQFHLWNCVIDVQTQTIQGLSPAPDDLEWFIRNQEVNAEGREAGRAEEARLRAIRTTHDWDNELKGWVPKGDGLILKYSRRRGYYPHPDQAMALAMGAKL